MACNYHLCHLLRPHCMNNHSSYLNQEIKDFGFRPCFNIILAAWISSETAKMYWPTYWMALLFCEDKTLVLALCCELMRVADSAINELQWSSPWRVKLQDFSKSLRKEDRGFLGHFNISGLCFQKSNVITYFYHFIIILINCFLVQI